MLLSDYHTHNGFSRCVHEPWAIEDGWAQAKNLGLGQLGITNHVHYNSPAQEFLVNLKIEIDEINDPNLLLGVELDIDSIEGHCVLNSATWDLVDYVIAGPHNQPTDFLLMPDISEEEIGDYFEDLKQRLVNSMKKIPFQIWVHPFLQEFHVFGDKYWIEYQRSILNECLPILADKGIAIEINTDLYRPLLDTVNSEENITGVNIDSNRLFPVLSEIYQSALEYPEIQFSFGSDAHNLERVGDIVLPYLVSKFLRIPSSRILHIEKKC